MKFSIGYQPGDAYDSIPEIARDFKDRVSDVYFACPGEASGRSPLDPAHQRAFERDLDEIRGMGIGLTLLVNASCYGEDALSRAFRARVWDMVARTGATDVTTTSPAVAAFVKEKYPDVRVCASVNMRIGSPQAMDQLDDFFDAYYLRREHNRDLTRVKALKDRCDARGKTLKLLANSGCLYDCGFQTFHDNLVSHEAGVKANVNAPVTHASPCRGYLARHPEDAVRTFLAGTWIRPEDVAKYEPYFPAVKLATRMHANPRKVLAAYARGRYDGSLFDLMEPSFSELFHGFVLDNARVPSDWFDKTANCARDCAACGYCERVARAALMRVS